MNIIICRNVKLANFINTLTNFVLHTILETGIHVQEGQSKDKIHEKRLPIKSMVKR